MQVASFATNSTFAEAETVTTASLFLRWKYLISTYASDGN